MSNVQIPNLPASIALNGNEQLEAVQAGTSVRVTTDQIATYTQAQYPAPGVSSIATTAPITGGTITSTGTIGLQAAGVNNSYLASMAGGTVKANVTGSPAQPSDASVSSVLDVVGSTRGTVLYRGVSNWSPLLPGSANNILISNGLGTDPSWQSISATLDTAAGSTQGAILYRSASTWTELSPGLSGQILQTNGGGADPSWVTLAGTGTVTQINTGTGLTGGPITISGTVSISNTGVSAASYGSASAVPAIAINAQGQITSAVDTAIAIPASQITSGTLGVDRGGTGLTTTPANGQIDIGNGVGFSRATLTAGSGVSITNGAGSVTISATGLGGTVTSVNVSGGSTGLTTSGGPVTSSGTITLAGTLAAANGGTGQSSYTIGDLLYASGATALSRLADIATGNALISGGVATAPSWGKIGLTTHVSGTLPVANGGTGTATAFTAGSVVFAGASGVYAQDNTNLFFDDTNNRLGIGTASPDAALTVNTVASFGAGAAALPSIAAKGDLNTGMWFPAADTVAVATGGTERMRVNSSGNVGIGTSSPGTTRLYISGNRATDPTLQTWDTFNGATFENAALLSYDGTKTFFYNFQANPLAFGTNNAERLRIDASGNVGIGTSAPGNKLDIVSAGTSQIRVKDGINAAAYYDFGRDGTDGFFGFSGAQTTFSGYKWSINAGTEVVRITNGGNVGIGTASPDAALTVNTIASFGAGAAALPSIAAKGDLNTGMWFPAADTIAASTGGVERLRIDSNGNVGIGCSPGTTLDVNGAICGRAVGVEGGELQLNNPANASVGLYIDVAAANAARIYSLQNNCTFSLGQLSGTGGIILLYTAAAERLRIDSSGNVGIGTSSPSASAILDAQSTTKGVRFPNMTTTEKNAIASPAAGLVVFDTTLAKLCVYSGAAWQTITSV